MLRTLDRYLIREIAMPFAIALVLSTFILQIPPILREGEALVARGVPLAIVARLLINLLPQALSLTIPMAVLGGILIGFGRLSGDREFVAMQACGVSLGRLLRPVALVAVLATAATAYETIVALPAGNQSFREITFNVIATRVESSVKPGVFFEDFPNRVIYVRSLPPGGGWKDVFLSDTSSGDQATVYFAKEGRIVLDREKRLVQLHLIDGTSHTTYLSKPEAYEGAAFDEIAITLDPTTVFPPPPSKGAPEMTFAELDVAIAQAKERNDPAYAYRFMWQQKLSLPMTCPILALIGLALGASSRKDGKLAGFVLGFGVIFVYYVLLWMARAFAHGGRFSPEWAPWIPNIIMGSVGLALLAWRARSADRPIRFSLPACWQRRANPANGLEGGSGVRRRVVLVIKVPRLDLPMPRLLDLYVAREYGRTLLLCVAALLGIFYIATFIDLADKMFRGEATTALVLRFFYFQTPQFIYYVIPIAVLVSTLVTIGVMTKNSELLVMRACGISLYRTSAPLVLFGLLASAVLYGLQEQVLATANREADRLDRIIRSRPPKTSSLDRRWIVGSGGEMYHYDLFDTTSSRFTRLWVYRVDDASWRLEGMDYASDAIPSQASESGWIARAGWTRDFVHAAASTRQDSVRYAAFAERDLPIERPDYFKSESPAADQMTYGELKAYVERLSASGADVVPYMVALQRKVAFPFVAVIMTLLAIPFAVTTGRRGALDGIGIGIALAIVYWTTFILFTAVGSGGLLPPTLAAWASNILFGAAAAYMILTVRT